MSPANSFIPHNRVELDSEEISAVGEALSRGEIARGGAVKALEEAYCEFMGSGHAAALNSGTSALHLTLCALDIALGDTVVIPSYVCPALLNAVSYVSARPLLIDNESGHTFNMAPEPVQIMSPKPSAVIVPHMFGLPARIEDFVGTGAKVVEDCAHAIGSEIHGKKIGTFGKASIVSFYATKMLGAIQGGMVWSEDLTLIEEIRDIADYMGKPGWKRRYNYVMSNVSAVVALSRLKKIDKFVRRRREIGEYYYETLQGTDLKRPVGSAKEGHVYYRFVVRTPKKDKFEELMRLMGIGCGSGVLDPLHRRLKRSPDKFPHAESDCRMSVSLPIYPGLTDEEVKRVAEAARRASQVKGR